MQTCPSTPEPLQVLEQAKDHTPREQQTVVRPEVGEREGKHILPHISERERSRTHTYAQTLRNRAPQAKHDAGTWNSQISPKPELAKLTIECCRTRLLHLAPHVGASAGVQQALSVCGIRIGAWESTVVLGWMWRGSVTAPPCAAPHHPTCTGTGYAPYPVGDLLVGPFQTPYRPITGRCGQALRVSYYVQRKKISVLHLFLNNVPPFTHSSHLYLFTFITFHDEYQGDSTRPFVRWVQDRLVHVTWTLVLKWSSMKQTECHGPKYAFGFMEWASFWLPGLESQVSFRWKGLKP